MAMAYRSGMAAADKAFIITNGCPIRGTYVRAGEAEALTMRMRMHDLERTRNASP
jgi:hypothetical protein